MGKEVHSIKERDNLSQFQKKDVQSLKVVAQLLMAASFPACEKQINGAHPICGSSRFCCRSMSVFRAVVQPLLVFSPKIILSDFV